MLLRRSVVLVFSLVLSSLSGVPLSAEEPPAAVERLKATVAALDPARDAAALGDAWLQLGLAYLKGMGNAEEALPAFLASAAVAPDPSSAWLWASVTAETLGRAAEAAAYRTRAVSPPVPPAPPAPVSEPVPEPVTPAPEPVTPAPAPEPVAPVPTVAAEPAPVEPAPAPDAIQHFFGEPAAAPPAEPVREETPAPAPQVEKEKKKVDAIDHFFGEKPPPPPSTAPSPAPARRG